jgi:hypothetical protein
MPMARRTPQVVGPETKMFDAKKSDMAKWPACVGGPED